MISVSQAISLSLFSVLRSDSIELDYKEISYLIYLYYVFFSIVVIKKLPREKGKPDVLALCLKYPSKALFFKVSIQWCHWLSMLNMTPLQVIIGMSVNQSRETNVYQQWRPLMVNKVWSDNIKILSDHSYKKLVDYFSLDITVAFIKIAKIWKTPH